MSRIQTSGNQKGQGRIILKRIPAETRGCGLDSSDTKYSIIVNLANTKMNVQIV